MEKLLDYMDEEVLSIIPDRSSLSDLIIDLERPEVNIKEIAEKLGCNVTYKYLFSEIGSYNEETKEIIVNLFDPDYRQRFTLAHELAHHLLQHKGVSYREGKIDEYDVEYILREREANKLAASILMPKKIINYIYQNISDDNVVKFFSEKFNVSYTAMEYRLKNLGKI